MKKIRFSTKQLKIISCLTSVLVLGCVAVAMASSGGENAAPKGWVATDSYKVLNFVVLILVLFFVAKKPVKEFFSSRTKGIENELAELEQKKKTAEKKLAEYEAKFKNLDAESKQILEDYIKQGEQAKIRILEEARKQADKLEEMAKRNIQQEIKSAKATLKSQISEMAMEKAEALIKDSISSDDQDRLVHEYLKKVVA